MTMMIFYCVNKNVCCYNTFCNGKLIRTSEIKPISEMTLIKLSPKSNSTQMCKFKLKT